MKPETLPQLLRQNNLVRPGTIGHRYKQRGIWKEYSWSHIYEKVTKIDGQLTVPNIRSRR